MTQTWLRVLLVTLYCVIFVLGIAGNSLVVYVIVRNKSMQNPTNIFINNLALSDIMMCLLAVPFTPISGLSNSWIFGEVLCYVVPMSLGVSVHVSTMTSIAIAVDRYFAIVHPFRPRITTCACCVVTVAVWIAATTVSLPLAIFQHFEINPETNVAACQESLWLPGWTRQGFTVASLVLQYIVPCGIITICYSLVSAALSRRARLKKDMGSSNVDPAAHRVSKRESRREGRSNGRVDSRGRGGPNNEREQIEIRRKRRTNRMLIAMVAIFVCCWLPLNVMNLTVEYYQELAEWNYFLLLFFSAHVIAMSSTVYNPFLYTWMNESFKKEFKKVIPCLFVCNEVC